MSENLIQLKGVTRVFSTDEVDTHAMDRSDLAVERGEHLPISGPFGCGKSTLLAILGLLDSPSGGTCLLGGLLMLRSVARVVLPVGMIFVSVLAPLANAQVSPDLPNPIAAPNPLTMTLSIFRSNMQDKITKAADMMLESKYSYRPTKDVRSFAEIVTHVADISYFLCSKMKGEATPHTIAAKSSKAEIQAYLKGSFDYCDGAFSGFTDAHLNDPADFFGDKTNMMFILTQVGNHDALHYGNLVTYLRINGRVPSGGWF